MSDWWIPRSIEELEAAVTSAGIEENHHCEIKQFENGNVPTKKVARAVASLAVDGGAVIVGLSELDGGRFALDPRPLDGLVEAVDLAVANRVSPALRPTIRELARNDGDGYLVVIVPTSPSAPHMFDGRYYARNERTSQPLSDIEVRRLWRRNLDRRDDLDAMLAREVEREPVQRLAGPTERSLNSPHARLFTVAQPVSADPALLLNAAPDGRLLQWTQSLNGERLYSDQSAPPASFVRQGTSFPRARGVARSSPSMKSNRRIQDYAGSDTVVVDLEIQEDGGIRLFNAHASAGHGPRRLNLPVIVGEVVRTVELSRVVSRQASFRGPWRFGVALRRIHSLAAAPLDTGIGVSNDWTYSDDAYEETTEVDGSTLDEPGSPIVLALLGRFLRADRRSLGAVRCRWRRRPSASRRYVANRATSAVGGRPFRRSATRQRSGPTPQQPSATRCSGSVDSRELTTVRRYRVATERSPRAGCRARASR